MDFQSAGEVVIYPKPSAEKIRKNTSYLIERLEKKKIITAGESAEWKRNIEHSLE